MTDLLSLTLLQLIVILATSRIVAYACEVIRQPTVIGQVIAGILLGPSFLGLFFPDYSSFLFAPKSLAILKIIGDLGLIFLMFIVGLELELSLLKHKARQAVAISYVGIIVPFALGIGFSFLVYETFMPKNVPFMIFALFMGIAMSITAFPVLARIVRERGIVKTHLGTMALASAAIDDVTAWCLLALIIGLATASGWTEGLIAVSLAAAYAACMMLILRPLLRKYSKSQVLAGSLPKFTVSATFIGILLSSYVTEMIGLHALFGAFVAGLIMPRDIGFNEKFMGKIEDVALVVLLPVFFAISGLRTQIGLLNEWHEWLICLLAIVMATAGKFGGCCLAARWVGEKWRESVSIGILMNTRGLMELVVLNIGYELGVLDARMFSILVLMALVTTFLTSPMLDFVDWVFRKTVSMKPMSRAERALFLRDVHLFKFLPSEILELVAESLQEESVGAGTTLFARGDEGAKAYMVVSGEIRVEAEGSLLRRIHQYGLLGEIGLLGNEKRTANAVVQSDAVLLTIQKQDFLGLIETFPEVSKTVINQLLGYLQEETRSN